MLRLIIVAAFIFTAEIANGQTPGVDPRGVAVNSSPVIVGIVEEPWQIVIRPDRIPKGGVKVIPQADGTKLLELPPISRNHVVGYLYAVRVQEVLKGDQWVRANRIIQIFAPQSIEGGVALPPKQRFLLALARFEPKKEVFGQTSVSGVSAPRTKPGIAFDLRARYYQVASGRNGVISITDKNLTLIEEIKSAIRKGSFAVPR